MLLSKGLGWSELRRQNLIESNDTNKEQEQHTEDLIAQIRPFLWTQTVQLLILDAHNTADDAVPCWRHATLRGSPQLLLFHDAPAKDHPQCPCRTQCLIASSMRADCPSQYRKVSRDPTLCTTAQCRSWSLMRVKVLCRTIHEKPCSFPVHSAVHLKSPLTAGGHATMLSRPVWQADRLPQASCRRGHLGAAHCLLGVARAAMSSPSGCLAASAAPVRLASPFAAQSEPHCRWWTLCQMLQRAAPPRSVPQLLWCQC